MSSVLERSSIVIPTIGRPSLDVLLDALAAAPGPRPAELVLVDDRPAGAPLRPERPGLPTVRVVRTGGGGPARARNLGWRTAPTEWIAFLDDDVVPDPDWYQRLEQDLAALPADVAGSQGRVRVPLPDHRRPTDWERGTAGLATSSWITADLAYRRDRKSTRLNSSHTVISYAVFCLKKKKKKNKPLIIKKKKKKNNK